MEVEAPGDQNYNAAIGGLDQQTGGRVTIHDGSVKATAGKGGSGIGGGWGGNGEVTVYGGAVEAITCDIGAGLGSGTFGVGTVTIHGGSVTATATGSGAAIGGGYVASERQFVCDVTIKGGCVTASATSDGAAIGGGLMDRGTLDCDVSIKGGSVTASASGNGAAIGGGRVNDGSLDCVVSLGLTQDTDYVNAQSYRANNDTLTLTQPLRILGESGRFTGSTGTRTFAGEVVIPASSGDTLLKFPDNADFTLPDDITEVGTQAFEGISATTVEAPAGVTEVGANAFSGSGLQKIRFLGEHTIVDAAAFTDCESATAFAIPGTDTWKSLGVIPGIILMPIT